MVLVQESQTLSQRSNECVPICKSRDAEVATVAKRRQFTAAHKRQIVRTAAACNAVGGIGKLLREEGLYRSHLAKRLRELEAEEQAALAPKQRSPKADTDKAEARRIVVLEQENNRLRRKLPYAEHIIAAQKKLCELLGSASGEEAMR